MKKSGDREVEEEGREIITSLNKKLNVPASKTKELARKGADLEKDEDFDEDAIVDKHEQDGKLNKIVVARKDDGKNERQQDHQKNKKHQNNNNYNKKFKKN